MNRVDDVLRVEFPSLSLKHRNIGVTTSDSRLSSSSVFIKHLIHLLICAGYYKILVEIDMY